MTINERTSIAWWVAVAVLGLAACGDDDSPVNQEPTTTVPDESDGAVVDPSRIPVPPSVRSNLGITFVTVERRLVEQTRRIPGRFEYLPTARREYRTMLPGRVELLVQQFERIEAGQALFRVQSPAWHEIQQQLAEAESSIERLEVELAAFDSLVAAHNAHEGELQESISVLEARVAKLEELGEAGGGRITELAEACSALAGARAALAAAQEKGVELVLSRSTNTVQLGGVRRKAELLLRSMATLLDVDPATLAASDEGVENEPAPWRTLSVLTVTAQQAGVVESISVTDGSWADERALVLSTVQPDDMRFRAMGLQSDLGLLRDGLDARIVPPAPTNARRAVGLQDTMQGKLSLGLAADAVSRTVDLFVVPENLAAWARPGVTAQLEIAVEETAAPELAVPLAAVQQDGLEAVLFRRNPKKPNEVIRIEGDLGVNDGRWVSVLSGLRDGDEVVLDGSFQLMLATSGSMQKGGHFHADGTFHEGEH